MLVLDFAEFQLKLELSLETNWKKALSLDWFPKEKALSFSLEEFYVGLKWAEKKNLGLTKHLEDLNSIFDIFNVLVTITKPRPIKIFITGNIIKQESIPG